MGVAVTAVTNMEIVGPTDAELARAAATVTDRRSPKSNDRYADRLHDFCIGMLRDRDGAADCVQDAFCTAATRLTQLREPDNCAVAVCHRLATKRCADSGNVAAKHQTTKLPDDMSHEPGPDTLAARTELADLIAEAAGGLSDRDRSSSSWPSATAWMDQTSPRALGVSRTNANTVVHRLRETIERSLARCWSPAAPEYLRRMPRAGRGPRWLGRTLHDPDAQTHRPAHRVLPQCDEDRPTAGQPAALLGAVPVFHSLLPACYATAP